LNENDFDPIETKEWLEAIDSVIEEEGIERASFILSKLANK
jgi:pyruvate dehydrogenase E1 component